NYAISTIDSSVANINFSSFVDSWGGSISPVSQSYSLDSGNPGYNDPFGGPSTSAYVLDHSCFNRYNDPAETCQRGEPGLNHAFRSVVPEPGTWALMIAGFGMVGFAMRRRSGYATA
ncbi:MAG: PEPxxWA-CTERM sorting domain-containing protein, partial [Polymorphobacter sp.]